MKLHLVIPLSLCFLFPTKMQASQTDRDSSVCESFAAGKIDAFQTLKTLDLYIEDFSIGVNNSAKCFSRIF